MRLVDADDLHEMYMKWLKKEIFVDEKKARTISIADSLLMLAPVVKAVPLSFIRDEVERLDKCNLTELADYMRNVLKYYDAVERGEETW